MDLSTSYLGFELPHPLMPGASPLVDDLDTVRRLEDAGAAAIVMHSLFEEQIELDQRGALQYVDGPADSYAEALTYFPRAQQFALGPDRYLEQVRRIKDAVDVPVIGSLNGITGAGWLEYAKLVEQAGADALELNVYYLATRADETAAQVEQRVVDIAAAVKAAVRIPVAVKLSPFFSALPHLAHRLDQLHVDGLVIFNRFYQPDIDPEALEVVPRLHLSDSSELLVRLRWLAILSGHVQCSLAATGGIHTALDAIKAVMAGAHAVQMVSLARARREMAAWLEEHEYESLRQMQGSMNLLRCPDPSAFERANYMRVLLSWTGRPKHTAF